MHENNIDDMTHVPDPSPKDASSNSMSDDNGDDSSNSPDEEAKDRGDLSGEAAGVVRGVSRSIVRAPMIGRLPRSAGVTTRSAGKGILRQRLPVRQVARVSDRFSTGLDWWSSAVESSDDATSTNKKWARIRSFATTVLRNTLLGLAVFESYGYMIGRWAPPLTAEVAAVAGDDTDTDTDTWMVVRQLVDDENDQVVVDDEPDEYARASLPVHFGAGFLAGSVHGIAASVMEGHATNLPRYAMLHTVHHSLAHSILFGSYEAIKRTILHQVHSIDDSTQYFGGAYLTAFGVAGGMAGQLQHITSHYTEEWLGLSSSNSNSSPLTASLRRVPAPALRPVLWAFPPSAIGFIAFEYGKKFMT
jgi:hypothetical protein